MAEDVGNLGPAPAAVVWTQGCEHRPCRDCMSPHTWDPQAGVYAQVVDVARWLASTRSRFLTVAGGEPFEQAEALNGLLGLLSDDWVTTVYTGFEISALRTSDQPGVMELLDRIDLLIDGPYLPEQHAPLLWRGSRNQLLNDLTGRAPIPAEDVTAGVTVSVAPTGVEVIIGVPPTPGFVRLLHAESRQRGIRLRRADDPPTFPFPVQES